MLERIYHIGIERAVSALIPRDEDTVLTDTQRHAFKQSWGILAIGLFRSAFAFLALFYVPLEQYSADVLSGLIHFMFTLWLVSYACQLAANIRLSLYSSPTTSFLTILPATGAARVDAVLRNQFWFLAALPIELLTWHLIAAFSLGLPFFPLSALISLGMAVMIIFSIAIIQLRITSRVPSLITWLHTLLFIFFSAGFVEKVVKKKIPMPYGIEDVVNFIGRHLAIIGDVIPVGWFFRPSVGESIHPLHWLTGFVIIGIATFLFKSVYANLEDSTELQIAKLDEIDLNLLLLGEDELEDYLEELEESEGLMEDSGIAPDLLISNALRSPSPDSVIPGASLERRLIRRSLDTEDCEILEAFHTPSESGRSRTIRAWILIGLVIVGQFFTRLPIEEFWVILFQGGFSIIALLSLCPTGSGLRAAYAETDPVGHSSAMVVRFPVSIGKLSLLRMRLVSTFSLIHLPPALFVIAGYWLCHFYSFDIALILIGGFSFAIFGTTAFLILQWYTTAFLLLKMGRSFINLTFYISLSLFTCLNLGWCFVVSLLFSLKFGTSWIFFFALVITQAAVCVIAHFIGMRRLRKPTVDLCGKKQNSFTLT